LGGGGGLVSSSGAFAGGLRTAGFVAGVAVLSGVALVPAGAVALPGFTAGLGLGLGGAVALGLAGFMAVAEEAPDRVAEGLATAVCEVEV